MERKAKELRPGQLLDLSAWAEVIEVIPGTDSERVKVKLAFSRINGDGIGYLCLRRGGIFEVDCPAKHKFSLLWEGVVPGGNDDPDTDPPLADSGVIVPFPERTKPR